MYPTKGFAFLLGCEKPGKYQHNGDITQNRTEFNSVKGCCPNHLDDDALAGRFVHIGTPLTYLPFNVQEI